MNALRIAIAVAWVAFWIYWLLSAVGVKQAAGRTRRRPLIGLTIVLVVILVRVLGGRSGPPAHGPVFAVIGTVLFVCGLALAIWARVHLGRNWGMPMTEKSEPELVTSGPYRFIRHPIYSGILLATFGTALVIDLFALIIMVILGVYFYYSATVEERNLTAIFPTAYPAYQTTTKMLIPFVL